MSWWGKLVGGAFGFMLGGPLGAILGAALGHNFDKGLKGLPDDSGEGLEPGDRERVQMAFFSATFSVMGAVAKADGRVSEDEIALARSVMDEMDLSAEHRQAAINLFNQGKEPDFPLQDVLAQFRQECHRRNTLIQMFIEIQLQAAYADGRFDPAEERLLLEICRQLGIPQFVFRRLQQMIGAQYHARGSQTARPSPKNQLADAYATLGLSADVSDAEVKRAYRRLINQHHPDKLVAKGLPEEMMKVAADKTHQIKQAYEKIKQARGMR